MIKQFKFIHALLLGVFVAILLTVCGCGDGGGNNSAYIKQLQSENASLHSENDRLKNENEDLQNQIKENGYFRVATWIAIPSCFALFCIGLACGMKIKKFVLTNEKR